MLPQDLGAIPTRAKSSDKAVARKSTIQEGLEFASSPLPLLDRACFRHPIRGLSVADHHAHQHGMLEHMQKNQITKIVAARQSGATSMLAVYAAWLAQVIPGIRVSYLPYKIVQAADFADVLETVMQDQPSFLSASNRVSKTRIISILGPERFAQEHNCGEVDA